MQVKEKQNFLKKFLQNDKDYPVLAALAAGLYPLFFYFTNNFSLINTWGHLRFFVLLFVVAPLIGFFVANRIAKISIFDKWRKYVLPFLNIFSFLVFLKICLFAGVQLPLVLLLFVIAVLLTVFVYKHFKKIIVFQLLLAVLGLFTLIPKIISQVNYSEDWMVQIDDIDQAVFQKKPNVYFLQPDGYVNFSEMKKGNYQIENSEFEGFLASENFTNYADFRSNYAATLSSNSSTFMMKHHYYNRGTNFSESLNARNVIVSDNTVLNVFKNNGYRTYYVAELPYLLTNRPTMGFDVCNFSYDELKYLGTGLGDKVDILGPMAQYVTEETDQPKFFFVEIFNPGHIEPKSINSQSAEEQREIWIENLEKANVLLEKVIGTIKSNDPNALIIIMADHGGFVGMKSTDEMYRKMEDADDIRSIFSAQLSIHWPNGDEPKKLAANFKSSINMFRVLFSHLADEPKYLENLQDNSSYAIILKGAPKGIYKYIDTNGKVIFKKHYED